MAFATIHYSSRSLRKASSFNVVFPEEPAAPRPWAAFYLLHGLSDDNTIWTRHTSIERLRRRLAHGGGDARWRPWLLYQRR